MSKRFAVFFDMDGVLVNNNPVHIEAWKIYAERLHFELTPEKIKNDLYGRTNADAFRRLYRDDLVEESYKILSQEKEALYREIYQPRIKPVPGLIDFLIAMKENNVPLAIATSAIPENVEFVTHELDIKGFFSVIVNEIHVTKGKPDPQVYLLTAEKLGFEPSRCVVIEDSLSGVRSGLSAGCQVIGLTTTHSKEELSHTNLVIDDFRELTYCKIADLVG